MSHLPPSNPYIAGAALGGERGFFGRQDILREVERVLRRPTDNAIVLYGQRRIGKTSILLQLLRRLPTPPFVPIYFDLMDKARLPIDQVLWELGVTAATEVGAPLPERADFEDEPGAFQRLFLPQLYQSLDDEHRPVFLLDEFDVLDLADEQGLPQTASARVFRSYLRRLMTTEPRLAFVFVVGRRMEELSVDFLSTFKAALARLISVLRSDDARGLILQAEREGWLRYEEAAIERILALTRGHPYLTQLTCQVLFDRTFDLSPPDTPTITVADVEAVIPMVLEAGGHAFQWIWDGLPPAERIIFSAIASQTKEEDVLTEEQISAVLQQAGIRILVKELDLAPQTLVDWQMLEQIDGGYRFFVEVMRRWVAKHRPLDKVKDELDRVNLLADALYQAAHGFYQQGNNQQATAQLLQALEENPNHLKAHLLLGTIFRESGSLAEAVAEFEEVYRLDEREGRFELLRTLLQQGGALKTAGEEDAALAAYERVLQIAPNEQVAQEMRAAIWIQRGEAALEQDDLEAAQEAFGEAGDLVRVEQVRQRKRERELTVQLQAAAQHEGEDNWKAAVVIYETLLQEYTDDSELQARFQNAQGQALLAQSYNEALGALETGNTDTAQRLFADVIAQKPDYKEVARHFLRATNKVDVEELGRQLVAEQEGRQAAETQIKSLRTELNNLSQQLAGEREGRQAAEVQTESLLTKLDEAKEQVAMEQEKRRTAEAQIKSLRSELRAQRRGEILSRVGEILNGPAKTPEPESLEPTPSPAESETDLPLWGGLVSWVAGILGFVGVGLVTFFAGALVMFGLFNMDPESSLTMILSLVDVLISVVAGVLGWGWMSKYVSERLRGFIEGLDEEES